MKFPRWSFSFFGSQIGSLIDHKTLLWESATLTNSKTSWLDLAYVCGVVDYLNWSGTARGLDWLSTAASQVGFWTRGFYKRMRQLRDLLFAHVKLQIGILGFPRFRDVVLTTLQSFVKDKTGWLRANPVSFALARSLWLDLSVDNLRPSLLIKRFWLRQLICQYLRTFLEIIIFEKNDYRKREYREGATSTSIPGWIGLALFIRVDWRTT